MMKSKVGAESDICSLRRWQYNRFGGRKRSERGAAPRWDLASCVGRPRCMRGAPDHFPSANFAGHRPADRIAVRCAKENLKIDFRLEGNPFGHLTVRNFHAFPTGPSAIESIDIDYLYVDYSLLGLARHGLSHFLQDVEARSAQRCLKSGESAAAQTASETKAEIAFVISRANPPGRRDIVIRVSPTISSSNRLILI